MNEIWLLICRNSQPDRQTIGTQRDDGIYEIWLLPCETRRQIRSHIFMYAIIC